MDLQTFSAEIEKLTALPKEQVARAKEIAQSLDDAQLKELLEKLKGFSENLETAVTNQEESLTDFDVFLQDANKRMKKLDRSTAEAQSQAGELEQAEEKLSKL